MLDEATTTKAAQALLAAAPGSTVILFGSYARGSATEDSDLDFLVVMPGPVQRIKEMTRLRRVLADIPAAVDVLVSSAEVFEAWKDKINTVVYEAAHGGRVFHAA
jgi:predicted nucleotidyltransferase